MNERVELWQNLPEVEFSKPEQLSSPWQDKIKKANLNPQGFLAPSTPTALGEVLHRCTENSLPLIPCGHGTKLSWGGLGENKVLLVSTEKLDRLVAHAVDDLTVTVEAGLKFADLQAILHPTGQFIPLDPAYPGEATIGGIVATADSGSLNQRYGGVRDLVLGLSFVRADGEIAKAGGRVVKNVAGYDLMKLFTGSFGSLGIISQVTLRTYPLPEASGTVLLMGETGAIASLTQTLLSSPLTPTCADLLSKTLLTELEGESGLGLMVRFQSIPESVQTQTTQLAQWGQNLGLKALIIQENDRYRWEKVAQWVRSPQNPQTLTAKIGLLPDTAVAFLNYFDQLTGDRGRAYLHSRSGLGRVQVTGEHLGAIAQQLRTFCQQHQGFLTILESPLNIKQQLEPWGYTGNARTLMQQLKQKFDPQTLLSPGRFVV